jgi:hypothetical protein
MGLLPIVYEDVQCVEERVEIHLWHHPLGKVLCRHKVSAPSSLIGIMHKRSRLRPGYSVLPTRPLPIISSRSTSPELSQDFAPSSIRERTGCRFALRLVS